MNANAGSFAAEAEGAAAEYLFVQTFNAGTWAPKDGEDGVYILTLTGAAAQTVYFSDRPERIAGLVPTGQFLDALGFTPANPPNAALVTTTDAGEEVVVVELMNPVYLEDTAPGGGVTLTYEARLLDRSRAGGLASLAARQADADPPGQFGPASLFIDDCPDIIDCLVSSGPGEVEPLGPIPDGPWGRCWDWNTFMCLPCSHGQGFYDGLCNQAYPQCKGHCMAS